MIIVGIIAFFVIIFAVVVIPRIRQRGYLEVISGIRPPKNENERCYIIGHYAEWLHAPNLNRLELMKNYVQLSIMLGMPEPQAFNNAIECVVIAQKNADIKFSNLLIEKFKSKLTFPDNPTEEQKKFRQTSDNNLKDVFSKWRALDQ